MIAIAVTGSLALFITIPHKSEPRDLPQQPEVFTQISTIKEFEETHTTVDKEIIEPETLPIKHPFRPELTKAAFDLVKLQRANGATTTPEVWLLALEWCESNGDNTAINNIDLDGTPSYYAFQFKPSTFRHYGEKYGVIERGLSDQELMNELKLFEKSQATVRGMMTDPSVKWENQFPDCVRKHIGRPPEILLDMK
jgi:hypothetical protein